jgi:hypothetical protein
MMGKSKIKGLALFLAGFLSAAAVMFGVLANQDAQADVSCFMKGMAYSSMSGNVGDDTITVIYGVPSCVGSSGYYPTKIDAATNNYSVMVYYKKK